MQRSPAKGPRRRDRREDAQHGLLSYLRGTDLLGHDEQRALPRAENQYPLHVGYSGTPIRTVTTENVEQPAVSVS